MKHLFNIILAILVLLVLPSMRRIGGEFCRKASAIDLSKIQLYDTFERFSEFFNIKEHCWTSEEVITEEYFQMDIPVLEEDMKMHVEFRYGRIQKLSCQYKSIKIPCKDMIDINTKLNDNIIMLQKYTNHNSR